MTLTSRLIDPSDRRSMESVRALVAEAERTDGTAPFSDQALLAASRGTRTLIAFDDGEATRDHTTGSRSPVAVGVCGEGELDLVVRPDARGAGVGSAALAHLLAEADRETPTPLRAWAHGENPAASALLRGAGFAPVRTLYRLALDPARLAAAITESRAMPAGFGIEPFNPASHEHAESWVRVNAAAFADHPEQGGVTDADFAALRAEHWFDPEDLILARDESNGSLAGYTWIKTVRQGELVEAELYVLGVDPVYAGRGLGAALLGETLRRMSEHHPTRITLYVDGSNEHALALYTRAGFTVDTVSTQWLRNNG
ncbi:mycothiol synthase [Leucobacter sp. W1038]|uniref:mycothiol synthase n=1 Tax=Leucobacter sp. W1038 TaxID=3438281 RepID=UPI003D975C07